MFCFAHRVGIFGLQNAILDAIQDRATEQNGRLAPPTTALNTQVIPKPSTKPPALKFRFTSFEAVPAPVLEEPRAKYLPPATSTAIQHAYQNTPTGSPLRKLLADIFAYNVKPDALDEDILSFPVEYVADVLLINMKRLPLRLGEEKADFDVTAKNYHISESPRSSTTQRNTQGGKGRRGRKR